MYALYKKNTADRIVRRIAFAPLLFHWRIVVDCRCEIVLQRNLDSAAHELLSGHFHIVAGVDILYAVEGIGLPGRRENTYPPSACFPYALNTCMIPVESDASLYCHAIQAVSSSENAVSG